MRIGIIGQKWLASAVFDALVNDHEIAYVAAPSSGDRLYRSGYSLGIEAIAYGDEGLSRLERFSLDLIVCAHAHVFVPASVRNTASFCIGYHPSLLPLHRGKRAIEDTVAAGDKIAGGSIYHLNDEFDAGAVAFQEWCFVHTGETAADLWRRSLGPLGVELILLAASHLEAFGFIPANDQECLEAISA
ncbi:methionyl-tRNA formyltransferase [Brucella sp. 21LCYQ03]|nr:methionyl-tRNA formyltransferase [Brucella sp. 21LCYQ03]